MVADRGEPAMVADRGEPAMVADKSLILDQHLHSQALRQGRLSTNIKEEVSVYMLLIGITIHIIGYDVYVDAPDSLRHVSVSVPGLLYICANAFE